jgi:hypothetical protein
MIRSKVLIQTGLRAPELIGGIRAWERPETSYHNMGPHATSQTTIIQ